MVQREAGHAGHLDRQLLQHRWLEPPGATRKGEVQLLQPREGAARAAVPQQLHPVGLESGRQGVDGGAPVCVDGAEGCGTARRLVPAAEDHHSHKLLMCVDSSTGSPAAPSGW